MSASLGGLATHHLACGAPSWWKCTAGSGVCGRHDTPRLLPRLLSARPSACSAPSGELQAFEVDFGRDLGNAFNFRWAVLGGYAAAARPLHRSCMRRPHRLCHVALPESRHAAPALPMPPQAAGPPVLPQHRGAAPAGHQVRGPPGVSSRPVGQGGRRLGKWQGLRRGRAAGQVAGRGDAFWRQCEVLQGLKGTPLPFTLLAASTRWPRHVAPPRRCTPLRWNSGQRQASSNSGPPCTWAPHQGPIVAVAVSALARLLLRQCASASCGAHAPTRWAFFLADRPPLCAGHRQRRPAGPQRGQRKGPGGDTGLCARLGAGGRCRMGGDGAARVWPCRCGSCGQRACLIGHQSIQCVTLLP